MSDHAIINEAARDSAQEREPARHELTVKAASALFAESGVPRSPRSVQGFCKDGHIDCIRVKGPNGDRYFVNRQSVERYATELKQIDEVGKISVDEPFAQEREPARDSAHLREEASIERTAENILNDGRSEELEITLKILREENLNLKIDNRGKEQFINQLVQDRNSVLQSIQDVNYRLGVAETRVQQLEAPRAVVRDSAQEREAVRDDDIVISKNSTAPSTTTHDVISHTAIIEPPRRSFFRRIFGR